MLHLSEEEFLQLFLGQGPVHVDVPQMCWIPDLGILSLVSVIVLMFRPISQHHQGVVPQPLLGFRFQHPWSGSSVEREQGTIA